MNTGKFTEFTKGKQIVYVPTHADGDIYHRDCEYGFVTSDMKTDGEAVFCRYWYPFPNSDELRTKRNGEGTKLIDLVVMETHPQELVDGIIAAFAL